MIFNALIKLYLIYYLPVTLCAYLNLFNPTYESFFDIADYLLSLLFVILSVATPLFLLLFSLIKDISFEEEIPTYFRSFFPEIRV